MTAPESQSCAIGVDVGGTKCAAGLVVLPEGRVVGRRQQPTNPLRGGAAVLADVLDLTRALIEEGALAGLTPRAVGIGVAELVRPDGCVLSKATIAWQGVDVAKEIRGAIRLSVRVEADVRAAARAEAHLGAGRGRTAFLYVTVGTGISASLVLKGVPYAGARGLTGTCASSRNLIPGDDGSLAAGPPLEQFSAGPALAARFAAAGGDPAATAQDVGGARVVLPHCRSWSPRAKTRHARPRNRRDGGGLGLGAAGIAVQSSMRCRHIWSHLHRDVPLVSRIWGRCG
jgi:glucokinase